MSNIKVVSKTQRIIVDPATSSISVINAGPMGPGSPGGLSSSAVSDLIAAAIAELIDSSPELLNTFNEFAAALGDDPNFAATMIAALANKQPLDGDLTAIAALTTTAYGRALLALADGVNLATDTAFATRYMAIGGTPWHTWTTANGDTTASENAVVSTGGGNWGTSPPTHARVQNNATKVRAVLRIVSGVGAGMAAGTMRVKLPRNAKFTSGAPAEIGTGFYMNSTTTIFCPFIVTLISATEAEMYYPATHNGQVTAVSQAAPFAFAASGTTVSLDLDYEPA